MGGDIEFYHRKEIDMNELTKRTWAEVSLSALEHNVAAMRAVLPENTRFLGVVKANAYGHGAVEIARRLEQCGAGYLAVACLDEALELRSAGITLPILILGATAGDYAPILAENDITQEVESLEKAKALSASLLPGQTLKIHLKLDTGMGRLGFRAAEDAALREAAEAAVLPGLFCEGCFTHFAVSDMPGGEDYTRRQYALFAHGCDTIEALSGVHIALRHCCNSGGVLSYREYAHDMVRPGLLTYGLYPDAEKGGIELRSLMSVYSRICAVTHHKKGDAISYGGLWTAERDTTLAVIPMGYADGLHRALSGKLEVLIHGVRCPQVGRICMDMCMIDVTDVEGVQVGDVATVFSPEKPIEELARQAGTISYELLCALSPRVPRIYME